MGKSIKLDVYEGGVGKEPVLVFSIDSSSEKISLREIIVKKVSEEFMKLSEEKNAASKCSLEEEVANAITAFEQGKYFVLVSDKQVRDLDEQLSITSHSKIEFYKLVPLEGG